jgi:hypothetical protein
MGVRKSLRTPAMQAHFKAFLYDTLVNLATTLLLDLLHLAFNLVSALTCQFIIAPALCPLT